MAIMVCSLLLLQSAKVDIRYAEADTNADQQGTHMAFWRMLGLSPGLLSGDVVPCDPVPTDFAASAPDGQPRPQESGNDR